MFKPIPGNHNYIISLNGEIRTEKGLVSDLRIFDNKVTISLYGVIRTLDITWLALIAHYEIDLPEHYLGIRFMPTNPVAIGTKTGLIMVFRRPILIDKKYKLIPNYTKYAISKKGELINVITGQLIKVDTSAIYPTVRIYDADYGYNRQVLVHRLVAMTWVVNDDYIGKPIVNHKDANKKNYNCSNLEWCNYSENNIHAINFYDKNNNFKYRIKDFKTGLVKKYKRFSDFSREMNLDGLKYKNRQYRTKDYVVNNRFEIKDINDNSPWLVSLEDRKIKNKYTISIIFPDGSKEVFLTIVDVMKRLKIWNISYNIKEIINVALVKYPGIKIDVVENIKTMDVQAYCFKTGIITEASTIRKLSLLTDVNYSTIQLALSSNKKYISKGYIFRYKSDSPWDIDSYNDPLVRKEIKITNTESNEHYVFDSMRSAASFLNVTYYVLKSRLEDKQKINGWVIEEI